MEPNKHLIDKGFVVVIDPTLIVSGAGMKQVAWRPAPSANCAVLVKKHFMGKVKTPSGKACIYKFVEDGEMTEICDGLQGFTLLDAKTRPSAVKLADFDQFMRQ